MKRDDRIKGTQELDAIEAAEGEHTGFRKDAAAWERMQKALEQLRIEHLPFRRATSEAIRELEAMRTYVTDKVASDPDLAGYYEEAWNGVSGVPQPPPMPLRRAVIAQLQLMECAFQTLQLHHYANAPENAGWIDLFRRWGASQWFNAAFNEFDRTLAPEFSKFYKTYLRGNPPQADATRPFIHHPWMARPGDRGRGVFMDSGLVEAKLEFLMPSGTGGHVDPKGRPGVDQTYEVSSAAGDDTPKPPTTSENE